MTGHETQQLRPPALTRRNLMGMGLATIGASPILPLLPLLTTANKAQAQPASYGFDVAIGKAHIGDLLDLAKKPTRNGYIRAGHSGRLLWDHLESTGMTRLMEQTVREHASEFLVPQPLAKSAGLITSACAKAGLQVSADKIAHMTDTTPLVDREALMTFMARRGSWHVMGHQLEKLLTQVAEHFADAGKPTNFRNATWRDGSVEFLPVQDASGDCFITLPFPFMDQGYSQYSACQQMNMINQTIALIGTIWGGAGLIGPTIGAVTCPECIVVGAVGLVAAGTLMFATSFFC